MSKAKLGSIVLYRIEGEQRASIVTKVNEDDSVNIHIFPNDHLDRQSGPMTRVKEGEEDGQFVMSETTPPVPPPGPKGKKAKDEDGE